jgi:DNA (cytosine-5)-methyltransferase 1
LLIFENVYGFTSKFEGASNAIKQYSEYVMKKLEKLGYNIEFKIIDMSQYGVPQRRKRFILLGGLGMDPNVLFKKLEFKKEVFLKEKGISSFITAYDAIGDLERRWGTVKSPDVKNFEAGLYGLAHSAYQIYMRNNTNNIINAVDSHRFVNHRHDTIEKFKDLLQLAPRGKSISPSDKIIPDLKKRGITVLDPARSAPTITSIPDDILHYCEPRILTVREHARLQSFPDHFYFKGKYTSGNCRRKIEVPRYTQVGNAIPPIFAEQVGCILKEVLI